MPSFPDLGNEFVMTVRASPGGYHDKIRETVLGTLSQPTRRNYHLKLGNEIIVGPQTGVGKPIPDKQIMSGGVVAMPHATWLRLQKVLPQLPELFKRVRRLDQKVAEIENSTQK